MAVDERARRKLHERLDEVLGDEAADTLMDEISSLGRDQLATRHDLQMLGLKVERDLANLRGDFLEAMNSQTKQLGIWMLGAMTTLCGVAIAASRI